MANKDIAVIILAAGLGKRMKSDLPKVLHPVAGKPMLFYPIEVVKSLKIEKVIVVIGHKGEEVIERLGARGMGQGARGSINPKYNLLNRSLSLAQATQFYAQKKALKHGREI